MKISSDSTRVCLRRLSMEDVDSVANNANDYDIAYNTSEWGTFPNPYRKEDAVGLITYSESAWNEKRGFHFGVRLKDTDKLIGVCGVKSVDYKNKKCEIGYWIGKDYWKNGYAREAVMLLVEFAFQTLDMNKVSAVTFSFNTNSIALLEKVGFRKEGVLREDVLHKDGFEDSTVFSMLKREHVAIRINTTD